MTKSLVLWRHAKSGWDAPDLVDFERPLAPRGHRAAPEMAGKLAAKLRPDQVVCSPARRAVETWEHLAFRLPGEVPVTFDRRIYEADWQDLLAVVQETPASVGRLLVVGHNPGLEELTEALAEPVGRKFATAAYAHLEFEGAWSALAPGQARLVAFRRPKRKGHGSVDDDDA